MRNDILIRPARLQDINGIEQIIEDGYRNDDAKLGWTHEVDFLGGKRLNPDEILNDLNNPNKYFFIAEINNKLEGVIQIEQNEDYFEFGKFAVNPRLQGSGLGKLLLQHAETFCKNELGAKYLHLCVINIRKELIEFYERRGYQDTKKRIDFLAAHPYVQTKIPIQNLELNVMRKSL